MNFATMLSTGPKLRRAPDPHSPALIAYRAKQMEAAQSKILKVLTRKPCTARELFEFSSHKSISALCQYLSDMKGRDLIEVAGYTEPSCRNRKKIIWRIKE